MKQDISTSTAATGGVQAHSVGDIYPFVVIKQGEVWGVMDGRTGGVYFPAAYHGTAAEIQHFAESLVTGTERGAIGGISKSGVATLRAFDVIWSLDSQDPDALNAVVVESRQRHVGLAKGGA